MLTAVVCQVWKVWPANASPACGSILEGLCHFRGLASAMSPSAARSPSVLMPATSCLILPATSSLVLPVTHQLSAENADQHDRQHQQQPPAPKSFGGPPTMKSVFKLKRANSNILKLNYSQHFLDEIYSCADKRQTGAWLCWWI